MKEEKLIMLIDDDMDDRFLFSRAARLKTPEIKCVMADGGKEALDLLNNMQQLPQVIFLDINMPGINGWELLSQFKTNDHLKNIPILIYSTSSHEKDISTAEHAGATGYCVKPLDFEGLQTILNFVSANLGPNLSGAIQKNKNITYFKHPGQH